MSNANTQIRATGLIMLTITLAACGGAPPPPTWQPSSSPLPTETSVPPTTAALPTETPSPPTATAPSPFTLAARPEEIIGTWRRTASGTYITYIRFYDDGTFHQGSSLRDLDTTPPLIQSYAFDGTLVYVKEIYSGGHPASEELGTYQVRLLEGGGIQIIVVSDSYLRATDTQGVYEPVP